MDLSIDKDTGCGFCQAFVTALRDTYTNVVRPGIPAELGKMDKFGWTFRDKIPHLPALARSANTGCSWCELLSNGIKIPPGTRFDNDTEDQDITITFHGSEAASNKTSGALGNIRLLAMYMTAPSDGSFAPCWGGGPCCGYLRVVDTDDFAPLSEGNSQKIRAAIGFCANGHTSCPLSDPTANPLRLLNITSDDNIKLENTATEKHTYAALSYCWGSSKSIEAAKTTQHNLEERTSRGLPLSSLPATLRDAVLVARSIGIDYLWIDALCIVQDCHKEWAAEAQKMMQYYGIALVTIVPIYSQSAGSGMRLGKNLPFVRRFAGPWNADFGSDLVLSPKIRGAPSPDDVIYSSVWDKRGWTYQEKLNSARVLYVFNHHLRLECRDGSWDTLSGWTATPNTSWRFIPIGGVSADSPTTERRKGPDNDGWTELVDRYTMRQLTNRRDRWLAFSGIVEGFSQATGRQVVAGLRKEWLLEDTVSWRSPDPWPPLHPDLRNSAVRDQQSLLNKSSTFPFRHAACNTMVCERTEQHDASECGNDHFPSWSWLSGEWSNHKQGVEFGWASILEPEKEPRAKLLAILNDNGDPSFTKLQVSGPVLHTDAILAIVSHARDHSLTIDPNCRPRIVFLDEAYDDKYACSCQPEHESLDCEAINIIASLSPAPSALLIGQSDFDIIPTHAFDSPKPEPPPLHWHFLLLQPLGQTPAALIEDPEFRRIGTMHVPGDHLDEGIERELRNQEPQTLVLV
ncbi:heterokaryon incompatibility protein-domain-containing protein [Immersiella caudata]|uniref:Heterokaryon incompatibility protein-domain-containing protein n=1 Tax=Immersiella caudata TaxID=314043 RepID=A0AA40CAU2_9PEZI|nr:heterokaryon incompatibility protein-domain-containing protein [Immersiella caudata]